MTTRSLNNLLNRSFRLPTKFGQREWRELGTRIFPPDQTKPIATTARISSYRITIHFENRETLDYQLYQEQQFIVETSYKLKFSKRALLLRSQTPRTNFDKTIITVTPWSKRGCKHPGIRERSRLCRLIGLETVELI